MLESTQRVLWNSNNAMVNIDLPFSLYRFQYILKEGFYLSGHLGGLWHSVLGKAIRDLACVTSYEECKQCMFIEQCDYTRLFTGVYPIGRSIEILKKGQMVPSPHVLRPVGKSKGFLPKGDTLCVDIILPGDSNIHFPMLVKAMYRVGVMGFGEKRIGAELSSIKQIIPGGIFSSLLKNNILIPHLEPQVIQISSMPTSVQINFLTPYIAKKKSFVEGEVDITALLMSLIRRISLIQFLYKGKKLSEDFVGLKRLVKKIRVIDEYWYKEPGSRYSGRSKSKIDTTGMIGYVHIDLKGCEMLWPYLVVGQWLNVGKNASMGFGHYRLEIY